MLRPPLLRLQQPQHSRRFAFRPFHSHSRCFTFRPFHSNSSSSLPALMAPMNDRCSCSLCTAADLAALMERRCSTLFTYACTGTSWAAVVGDAAPLPCILANTRALSSGGTCFIMDTACCTTAADAATGAAAAAAGRTAAGAPGASSVSGAAARAEQAINSKAATQAPTTATERDRDDGDIVHLLVAGSCQ